VYRRLETSRILRPVDDQPTWSVPCFFVAKGFRRQGVSGALLRAAVNFAQEHGAPILEGYPTECRRTQPDAFVYTGLATAFHRAGFAEVARRSAHRPIMRLRLGPRTIAK
jgi:GNAT superfamily N-acetyltransferase